GMNQNVELPVEHLARLREHAVDRGVVADIQLGNQRAADGARQLTDVLLDALALEREREPGPAVGEPLGDRPGDRPLVRDAEDEGVLSLEHARDFSRASAIVRDLASPSDALDADRARSGDLRIGRPYPDSPRH